MFDAEDRTEFPTPRRLEEARSIGSVPRSHSLCAAIVLLVASLALLSAAPMLSHAAARLWSVMDTPAMTAVSRDEFPGRLAMQLAGIVAGVLALACMAAVLANVAQFGFRATPDVVRPRWSRVDPAVGLARLRGGAFGPVGFVLKATCAAAVVAWSLGDGLDDALSLAAGDSAATLATSIGDLAASACLRLSSVLLALALGDAMWQRHRYFASLRMTRQEVLDEARGAERAGLSRGGRSGTLPPIPRT